MSKNIQKYFISGLIVFVVFFGFGCGKDESTSKPENEQDLSNENSENSENPETPEIPEIPEIETPEQILPDNPKDDEGKTEKPVEPPKVVGFDLISKTVELCHVENCEKIADIGSGAVLTVDKDNNVSLQTIEIKLVDAKLTCLLSEDVQKCESTEVLAKKLKEIADKDRKGAGLYSISEAFLFIAVDEQAHWETVQEIILICAYPKYKVFLPKISFLVKSEKNDVEIMKSYLPVDKGLFYSSAKPIVQLRLKIRLKKDNDKKFRIIPEPNYKPFHLINRNFNKTEAEIGGELEEMLTSAWDKMGAKIEIQPGSKVPIRHVIKVMDSIFNAKTVNDKKNKEKYITFSASKDDSDDYDYDDDDDDDDDGWDEYDK